MLLNFLHIKSIVSFIFARKSQQVISDINHSPFRNVVNAPKKRWRLFLTNAYYNGITTILRGFYD